MINLTRRFYGSGNLRSGTLGSSTLGLSTLSLSTLLGISLAAINFNASASCEYKISNQWGTALAADIIITNNTNSAVNSWNVGWQYNTNRVTSSWNANLSGSNPYSASNVSWNGSLQPGQSASFGLQVDTHGGASEIPTITGSLCSGAVISSSSSSLISSSSTPVIKSSSSVAAISSSSATNNNGGGQQCNWYGSLIALCNAQASGWGWENNQSCIGRSTCINIVSGETSSSSSSKSSAVSSSSTPRSSASSSSSSSSSSIGSRDLNINSASVTNFKGGAKGAYSIIMDDYCASWTSGIDQYGIPGLTARGLRAGVGAIGSECENNNYQARLHTVAAQGFEVVNHTWTHPSLVDCANNPNPAQNCSNGRPDLSVEIDKTRAFLEQATGLPVTFFIFPFNAVDSYLIDYLRAKNYLGARGGSFGLNPANFTDPITLNLLGNEGDMNGLPDQAVSSGSFAFLNMHGIADASYNAVPAATWEAHLDYVKKLVTNYDLWMDNPTAIVKYVQSKNLCGLPHVTGNVLSFTGAQANCNTYATGLTVNVASNSNLGNFSAVQNNIVLTTRRLSTSSVLINGVDPRYPTTLTAAP